MKSSTCTSRISNPMPFYFHTGIAQKAETVLCGNDRDLFSFLIQDQESELSAYVAKKLVDHSLSNLKTLTDDAVVVDSFGTLDHMIHACNASIQKAQQQLKDLEKLEGTTKKAILRERGPVSLISGCWLNNVSQPATLPSESVNALYAQYIDWCSVESDEVSMLDQRARLYEKNGLNLPKVLDQSFPDICDSCTSTFMHANFLLALSRYPVNYFPELLGVHMAYFTLHVDDRLLGSTPFVTQSQLDELLGTFLTETANEPNRHTLLKRVMHGYRIGLSWELQSLSVLTEKAKLYESRSMDSIVAELVAKHAPMAGAHHDRVFVKRKPMSDTFNEPEPDIAGFMKDFKASYHLKPDADGNIKFLDALKFGGPMFGIFDAEESRIFTEWAQTAYERKKEDVVITSTKIDDKIGKELLESLRDFTPLDTVQNDIPASDNREFLYRLVNIENYPNTIDCAKRRAQSLMKQAEQLYTIGAEGKYTNGTYFEYTPEGLLDRVEDIYWNKLVKPYKPLEDIPSKQEVIFSQITSTLGNLVDGSWSYRIANIGRTERVSDHKLFGIYADEMGMGENRKNHIILMYDVLDSMDIALPHISSTAFLEQDVIPDDFYDFPINQISMALFPDTHYPEIVGYNLAIEMYGLGEMRMHEIQKLNHWGFNPIYEEAHLSIDNASSGHARQSAELVNDYLDFARRHFGEAYMHSEWDRVWNGYCSFAAQVESLIETDFDEDMPVGEDMSMTEAVLPEPIIEDQVITL